MTACSLGRRQASPEVVATSSLRSWASAARLLSGLSPIVLFSAVLSSAASARLPIGMGSEETYVMVSGGCRSSTLLPDGLDGLEGLTVGAS